MITFLILIILKIVIRKLFNLKKEIIKLFIIHQLINKLRAKLRRFNLFSNKILKRMCSENVEIYDPTNKSF